MTLTRLVPTSLNSYAPATSLTKRIQCVEHKDIDRYQVLPSEDCRVNSELGGDVMNRAFIKGELQGCIEDLKNGELHEKRLQAIVDYVESSGPRQQDLLYLQARDSNLSSIIDGISLVENGEVVEGPADPDDWPYQSVLEAIRDGWRVIQFPNLALMMDEKRTYGLGCEFVLQRDSASN